TIQTVFMLQLRPAMNSVAFQASLLRAALQDVAGVSVSVTVGRIHSRVVLAFEVDFEIGKEIITGDKVVRIGKARGLRASTAQVALSADGHDFPRLTRTFASQPRLLRLRGVVSGKVAVARIAIKSIGGKRVCGGVNAGGMASGALRSKNLRLPGLAIVGKD